MKKKSKNLLTPTTATRKLQIFIAICSVIFTIGSALQNFVIVDISLIEEMMKMAGAPDPTGEAPGFTYGFRIVGCIYILGNALGILAIKSRSEALWWAVFVINITQALGFYMIPSSMWAAAMDAYGFWGVLPSAITDGGAIILSFVMIISMVKYKTTWAQSFTLQQ